MKIVIKNIMIYIFNWIVIILSILLMPFIVLAIIIYWLFDNDMEHLDFGNEEDIDAEIAKKYKNTKIHDI